MGVGWVVYLHVRQYSRMSLSRGNSWSVILSFNTHTNSRTHLRCSKLRKKFVCLVFLVPLYIKIKLILSFLSSVWFITFYIGQLFKKITNKTTIQKVLRCEYMKWEYRKYCQKCKNTNKIVTKIVNTYVNLGSLDSFCSARAVKRRFCPLTPLGDEETGQVLRKRHAHALTLGRRPRQWPPPLFAALP